MIQQARTVKAGIEWQRLNALFKWPSNFHLTAQQKQDKLKP